MVKSTKDFSLIFQMYLNGTRNKNQLSFLIYLISVLCWTFISLLGESKPMWHSKSDKKVAVTRRRPQNIDEILEVSLNFKWYPWKTLLSSFKCTWMEHLIKINCHFWFLWFLLFVKHLSVYKVIQSPCGTESLIRE